MDLSGHWIGMYFYPRRNPPVAFRAEIMESGGRISGGVTEVIGSGLSRGKDAYALIDGSRKGNFVSFLKFYAGDIPSHDSVQYEGNLDSAGLAITGSWRVPFSWSGWFRMTRDRPLPVSQKVQAEEEFV